MDTSFLTKSAGAERPGWAVTLITRLPGEPDLRKQVCGRNHPLARYALARVEEAEASASFCEWQASLSKRKAAARKSVATKEARRRDSNAYLRSDCAGISSAVRGMRPTTCGADVKKAGASF